MLVEKSVFFVNVTTSITGTLATNELSQLSGWHPVVMKQNDVPTGIHLSISFWEAEPALAGACIWETHIHKPIGPLFFMVNHQLFWSIKSWIFGSARKVEQGGQLN